LRGGRRQVIDDQAGTVTHDVMPEIPAGARPSHIKIAVDDIDACHARAIEAGGLPRGRAYHDYGFLAYASW
jgi:predicted enzyme related to lactoylglutathione lyase